MYFNVGVPVGVLIGMAIALILSSSITIGDRLVRFGALSGARLELRPAYHRPNS